MSHILVTGANGFIGSHLVRRLLELKKERKWEEEIVCMVRTTSDTSSLKGLDVKLIIGDVRDPESLIPAVKGATYIYHTAAVLFTISRKRFMNSIAVGTENLLKAAAEHAGKGLKRFLFVSSQAAAGPSKDKTPVTEDDPPVIPPVSWYAEAKLEAEKIAKTYMDKLPITIVRPCSVYGEREKGMLTVYKAVKMHIQALTGFRKRYTGMIYGKDLVEGIIGAAEHPKTIGETYFLTNPENYSVGQMTKTMGKAAGKPFGIPLPVPIFFLRIGAVLSELYYLFSRKRPIPTRDKVRDVSQVYWLCTPAKAKKDFGWEAEHSLLEGMKATCRFYKEEGETIKKMPLETGGILFLKYFILSLIVGIGIESLASFGNVYHFTPWWLVLGVVPGLWGFVFGSLAKLTRTCNLVVQFLPGFVILCGAELLNHYYLHGWEFPNDSLFGITDPLMRAIALGIATGFVIPGINGFMKQLYKHKLRLG
ncbi:MAG: NAD-dependent epimerase/dehydratase family protein [bacterium]|nr:NAD-dependent epimerase/dehydratase family protein [bacterium]